MCNQLLYLWVVSAALATTNSITVNPQKLPVPKTASVRDGPEETLQVPKLVDGRLPPKPEVYLPQHDLAIQKIIARLPAASEHHPAVTVVKSSKSEEEGHKGSSEGGHYEEKGGKSSKGSKSEHEHEKGQKGHTEKEKHVVDTEEESGKKSSSLDEASHGSHHDSHHGTAYDDRHKARDRYKKVGFSKGYRGQYHKDERHKLDKHWSNHHEKGKFANFGHHGEHYSKDLKTKDKGQHKKGGSDGDHHGKKKEHGGGHQDSDHKGHSSHGGHSNQYSHHSQYKKSTH